MGDEGQGPAGGWLAGNARTCRDPPPVRGARGQWAPQGQGGGQGSSGWGRGRSGRRRVSPQPWRRAQQRVEQQQYRPLPPQCERALSAGYGPGQTTPPVRTGPARHAGERPARHLPAPPQQQEESPQAPKPRSRPHVLGPRAGPGRLFDLQAPSATTSCSSTGQDDGDVRNGVLWAQGTPESRQDHVGQESLRPEEGQRESPARGGQEGRAAGAAGGPPGAGGASGPSPEVVASSPGSGSLH